MFNLYTSIGTIKLIDKIFGHFTIITENLTFDFKHLPAKYR